MAGRTKPHRSESLPRREAAGEAAPAKSASEPKSAQVAATRENEPCRITVCSALV